jgi:hypothetical protein
VIVHLPFLPEAIVPLHVIVLDALCLAFLVLVFLAIRKSFVLELGRRDAAKES